MSTGRRKAVATGARRRRPGAVTTGLVAGTLVVAGLAATPVLTSASASRGDTVENTGHWYQPWTWWQGWRDHGGAHGGRPGHPSPRPSTSPTGGPTTGPTTGPSTSPTTGPTGAPSPTTGPTGAPSPTTGPTTNPTTSPSPLPTASPTAPPTGGIRVAGNRIVGSDGAPVKLAGFNLSGAEYACIEGDGVFDTPDGSAPSATDVAAIARWKGTLVRIPLNEQCWLGLAGVSPSMGGAAYQRAVSDTVARLNQQGMVAVLDLHRSAPGTARSLEQEPMPDRDHSPAFWRSVASTFAGNPRVAFDLFNEPYPFEELDTARAWACWRDGGCTLTSENSGQQYTAAGMQELLDAVRGTGARNVVFVGGLYWAEGLNQWLTHKPKDPAGQLGASFHSYSFNDCSTTACYDQKVAPVMAQVPLLAGEIGPDLPRTIKNFDASCPASAVGSTGFSSQTIDWFARHGAAWTTWDWTPTSDCWSLASSWNGAPTGTWGRLVQAKLGAA